MPTIRISMETIEDPPMNECLDALRNTVNATGWKCLEAAHVKKQPHKSILERLTYDLAYAELYQQRCPDTDICAYIKCFGVTAPRVTFPAYRIITVGIAAKDSDWVAVLWQLEDTTPASLRGEIKKAADYLEGEMNKNKKTKRRPSHYESAAALVFAGLLSVFVQPAAPRRH